MLRRVDGPISQQADAACRATEFTQDGSSKCAEPELGHNSVSVCPRRRLSEEEEDEFKGECLTTFSLNEKINFCYALRGTLRTEHRVNRVHQIW